MRNRAFPHFLVPAFLAGLLLLLSAAALLVAPGATGAAGVDEVAQALRKNPVYVDPAASGQLSRAEADALAKKIKDADKPVFVAVLRGPPRFPRTASCGRCAPTPGSPVSTRSASVTASTRAPTRG